MPPGTPRKRLCRHRQPAGDWQARPRVRDALGWATCCKCSLWWSCVSAVLYVVYTVRQEDTIRLISARKADASERKQYRAANA
ncbi:MAG: BrnT family toxin [Rhodocyclaceae bacterium]|nr:BrnT family toxin [Rhodocyclaceae bacterium]